MSPSIRYSIAVIRDEVYRLVRQGIVSRQQPIYSLCKHIPAHQWLEAERELEEHEFLLRDRIGDLIAHENWENES